MLHLQRREESKMDPLTLGLMGGGLLAGNLLKGFGGQQASGIQSGAAQTAALWQALAAGQAQQNYAQYFGQAKDALNPYVQAGQTSMNTLQNYLTGNNAKAAGIGGGGANLLSTFQPTMEQLAQTPGYQFTLQQGQQAAQNSAAAKGLGYSGNAIKSGVDYASGLASTTFQQQLQNYMNQNLQAYNMLMGPTQIGATAAGQLGNAAIQTGQLTGNAMMGAGTALGQGVMGSANAQAQGTNALYGGIASGLTNVASLPIMAQLAGQGVGGNVTPSGPAELWSFATGNSSPFPSRGYQTSTNALNYTGGLQ